MTSYEANAWYVVWWYRLYGAGWPGGTLGDLMPLPDSQHSDRLLDPDRDVTQTRRYYTEAEIEALRRCDGCRQHDGFYSPEHAAHLCSHCLAAAKTGERPC